jgi:PKD repeat protein
MPLASPAGEAPAIFAIDGDINTTWHTEWSPNNVPPPHTIEIDMGAPDRVYCFGILPRPGDNGRPKDCIISTKLNPEDPWVAVATGTTVSNDNQQNFYFSPVDAQYLKLEILNSWSNMDHSAIQEVYAYNPPEIDFAANTTSLFTGESVKFTGYTSLDAPTWDWVFTGGTPSTGNTDVVDVVYDTPGIFDVTLNLSDGVTSPTLTKTAYITVTDIKIPRYGWKNAGYSSIDAGASFTPDKVFDDNATTFFYTPTVAPYPAFPHYYTVDMGKVNPVTALSYTPRASGTNGLIKDWEFWVSTDNVSFTKVKEGTWAKDNNVKMVLLDAKVDAQYFKLVILSNHQADPADTRAQIAELNAYGPVKIVDFTTEITNLDVNFFATANGTPTGFSWTFENGDPATSTEQNPSVSFTTAGRQSVTCIATYADGETSVTKEVVVRPFEIPRTSWTVVDVVDEEPAEDPNGYASNLFDGDLTTFWHTQWNNQHTPFPHYITVDMGRPYNMSALSFDQRSTGTGRPTNVVLYTSVDGIIFDETASARWANDASQKVLFFDNVEVQFFKFQIDSGYSWDSPTEPYSCGAEMQAYGQNVVIYWENPADIEIGTPLSTTQLNATSNFAGTFVYTPALETILEVGQHELSVEFTPDNVSLNPVSQTVTINVTLPLIPTSGWTVHFVDSYEFTSETTNAELSFDGDVNTFWHTQYDPIETLYPHQLVINMGAVYPLGVLTIDLRGGNGRIKDYEIWTSTTGAMNTDSTMVAGEWQQVAAGTWAGEAGGPQEVVLVGTNAQYFNIKALNEVYDQPYAAIREITAYEGLNVSVLNKSANSISIYPNPVSETLNIANLSDIASGKNISMKICDFNGRTVISSKLTDNSNQTVNVSNLSNGMYMLIIQSDKGVKISKFVKQ